MKIFIIFFCFFAFFVQGIISIDQNNKIECTYINYGCGTCYSNRNLEVLCDSCKSGYNLINNSCEYDVTQCTISSSKEEICNIPYCLEQNESKCTKCINDFVLKSDQCEYLCTVNSFFNSIESTYYEKNLLDCNNDCYLDQKCDKCLFENENSCAKCSNGYFLYLKKCVSSCPESTYANEQNSCIPCPDQCNKCISETNCISCKEEKYSFPPSCIRLNLPYYYQQYCFNTCSYSKIINENCERLCEDNYYPFYYTSDAKYNCKSINSWNNDYCYNVISQLKKLITITYGGNDSTLFHLVVEIKEIPQSCISLAVYGNNQAISFPSSYSDNNGVKADIFIENSKILNPDYVDCSSKTCSLFLNIYLGGQIQYRYQINVVPSLNEVISKQLIYTGNTQEVDVVCVECIISQEQTMTSSTVIDCQIDQICEVDSLTTPAGRTVSVTQKIEDPALKNQVLMPHSLRFSYYNQGYAIRVFITNYNFENNVPGEISFNFSTVGIQSGTVEIVSYIFNTKANLRLLYSSPLPVRFPIHQFNLKIEEIQDGEAQNSHAGLIGGIVVCLLLVILIIFAKIYQKIYVEKQILRDCV